MRLKTSALAAAIAATMTAPLAFSQSEEMTPPSSATQQSEQSYPGDSSTAQPGSSTAGDASSTTPGDMSGSMTDESAAAGGAQIDQKKVEQFADAYVEVQTIQQKANAELESAADPAAADQVKTTAQSDMIAAVERSGLQIEEFNQIVASMAADPELRSRVSAEVQKRVGGAATGTPGAGT